MVIAHTLAIPAFAAESGAGSLENFKPQNTYSNQFTDVQPDNWCYGGVKLCYEMGLMNGTSADTFSPNSYLTQAQLAIITARLYHIYTGGTGEIPTLDETQSLAFNSYLYLKQEVGKQVTVTPFNDVAERRWISTFVQVLGDEVFPAINHLTEVPDVQSFSNDEVKARILKLYNAGIIAGSDEYGTFYCLEPITRGAIATILARIIDPAQRMVLNLKDGGPPIVGVLNIDTEDCKNTNAVLDKYEGVHGVDRRITGVMSFSCQQPESAGGAGLLLTIRNQGKSGWLMEGIDFGEGAAPQYEVLFAFIDDVVEEGSRQAIKDMLNKYSETLAKDYSPENGISQEAMNYVKTLEGQTIRYGNVNCNWDFTERTTLKIQTASN